MTRRFELAKRMKRPASDPSRQLVPGTEYQVQPGGGGGVSGVPRAGSNGSPRGGDRATKPPGSTGGIVGGGTLGGCSPAGTTPLPATAGTPSPAGGSLLLPPGPV